MTVRKFKRAYDATKKAYEAVEQFENYVKKNQIDHNIKEDYEKKKNDAIQEYLQNQMPELDSAAGSLNLFNLMYLFF
jgi:hypothetical protein